MKMLITGPSLADKGGVAGYYNAVLPHLRRGHGHDIEYMEIGGTKASWGVFHPLVDQIRFRGILSSFSPEVVHVNPSLGFKSFIRDGLFIYQARRKGYPIVVFFRGWDKNFEAVLEKKWLWFFRHTYLEADAFIVLASEFRDRLVAWGVTRPVLLGTTTVSSELVRDFSIVEKLAGMEIDKVNRVLFLARLASEKGALETMKAVALLRDKGFPVVLTVAGDGECMPQVRDYALQHDPNGEFLFIVGDVRGDKKKELLATHHIYSFPSTYGEGMPNSMLEAMALGMAIVTCRTGGIRDFFQDGQMGYLVERRSCADVATALERLINEPGAVKRMSSFNHRYAVERFLAPGAARYLTDVYQRVVVASGV